MTSMRDQLWVAGQRYYDESGEEVKRQCAAFFRSLDSNGDGRVSMAELKAAVGANTIGRVQRLFAVFDKDGNGRLDFDECKALCFVLSSGRWCNACGDLILADGAACLHCSPSSSAVHHRNYRRHRRRNHPPRRPALVGHSATPSHDDHAAPQDPNPVDRTNPGSVDLCARCIPFHPPAHVSRLRSLPPLIQSPRYDSRSLPAGPRIPQSQTQSLVVRNGLSGLSILVNTAGLVAALTSCSIM